MNQITITTYQSATQLTAVITANDFTEPILGLAFDLSYDPEILSYNSYEEGAFLEAGGEPIYLVTDAINHLGGRLITGVTLRRTDFPVDLSGTVIAFNFDILNKTNTDLIFKNTIVSKINDQGQREDLDSIGWIDAEIHFATEMGQEVMPENGQELQETGTGTLGEESLQLSDIGSANIFNPESTLLLPVILITLPLLLLICYILWRKLIRKNALKTTNLSLTEPTQETTTGGNWPGI